MNKKQWLVLAWSFLIIGFMFIGLDRMNGMCLNAKISQMSQDLDLGDVWCVVNAEIYEPFIYLFYTLFVVFLICGGLEKEKEK